jgi:hypothetical protein
VAIVAKFKEEVVLPHPPFPDASTTHFALFIGVWIAPPDADGLSRAGFVEDFFGFAETNVSAIIALAEHGFTRCTREPAGLKTKNRTSTGFISSLSRYLEAEW